MRAIESPITIKRCAVCGIFAPQMLNYSGAKIVSHPCAHRADVEIRYKPVRLGNGRHDQTYAPSSWERHGDYDG